MQKKLRKDITFAYIKPENGMSNEDVIIKTILENGFEIIEEKLYSFTLNDAEWLYRQHEGKDFFPTLIKFTCSAPVKILVLKKENAVQEWRNLIGDTKNPQKGTIRARFAIANPGHKNTVHGSDSDQNAMEEICMFFSKLTYLFY